MLIAFYSTLIIFFILFVFALSYLIRLIKRKEAAGGNILALSPFILLSGIISGIYGFDFIKLQTGGVQAAHGECSIEFNENGKSIAMTTIELDEKVYQIKGSTYKHLPDGNYQCQVHYLPATKIVQSLQIE